MTKRLPPGKSRASSRLAIQPRVTILDNRASLRLPGAVVMLQSGVFKLASSSETSATLIWRVAREEFGQLCLCGPGFHLSGLEPVLLSLAFWRSRKQAVRV